MTTTAKPTSAAYEPAITVGFVLLMVCTGVGALIGFQVGGAKTPGDYLSDTKSTVNTIVTTSGTHGFNWLFFSIFLAAGLICFAICYAAASLSSRVKYFIAVAIEDDSAV